MSRRSSFTSMARWTARVTPVAAALLLLATAQARKDDEHLPRGSSPLDAERGKVVTRPDVPDPHGDAGMCTECHTTGADGALDSAPPMAACERCHPDTNFHLVGVVPEEVSVPPVMLLQDGQVACLTCHDEPACDGLPKDGRGADHFRDGTYPSPLAMCFSCHERDEYQQTDPHRDLRTADGERNDAVCVFCHQGVPESESDQVVEILRIDPVELCKGCHAKQIHVGIPSHLKLAPQEMAVRIAAYNAANPYPIPLGPRGEITCTTCHDPHPGLEPLPVDSTPERLQTLRDNNRTYRDEYYLPRLHEHLEAITDADGNTLDLVDGPRSKDGLLRVPAEDGTMCLICHDLSGGTP